MDETANRFARYLQELHELFGVHRVRYGHPGDLQGFNARVEAGGAFPEDVSSILRSAILREGGALSHTELLEMAAAAVCGPGVEAASAEMQPEFRRLLSFVGGVAGRPWNVPPGTESGRAASAEPGRAFAEIGRSAVVESGRVPVAEPVRVEEGIVPARVEASPEVRAGRGAGPVLLASGDAARAGADAASSTADTAQVRPAIRFSTRAEREQEDGAEPVPVPAAPVVAKGVPSSAPLWIGAVCAIGLVIGVVFYSHASFAGADVRAAAESVTLPEPVRAAPVPEARQELTAPPVEVVKPGTRMGSLAGPARAKKDAGPGPGPVAAARAPVAPPLHMAAAPSPDALLMGGASGRRAVLGTPVGRAGKGPYFLVSSGIMASHLLQAPAPAYPVLARMTHIQGQVVVQAVISTDGQVIATRVLDGHRLLRGAAVAAVKQWRYKPYVMEGRPVNVATIITVEFHAHS